MKYSDVAENKCFAEMSVSAKFKCSFHSNGTLINVLLRTVTCQCSQTRTGSFAFVRNRGLCLQQQRPRVRASEWEVSASPWAIPCLHPTPMGHHVPSCPHPCQNPPRGARPYSEGGSTDSLCSFLQWRLTTSPRNLQATQFFLQKSSFEFIAGGQLAVSLHLS